MSWERTVAKSALENYGRHHTWCALLKDPLGACDCGFSRTLDEIGRRKCAKCEGVLAELPVTGGFCMKCGDQPDMPAPAPDTPAAREFTDAERFVWACRHAAGFKAINAEAEINSGNRLDFVRREIDRILASRVPVEGER